MKHLLTVIQGEGLGDGIPRAKLTVVTEANMHLFTYNPFDTATVTVLKPKGVAIQLRVRMIKNNLISIEDVKEWLGSEFHANIDFGVTDVKAGTDIVTYVFPLTNKQAAKLGYRGRDGECVILKRAD